MSWRNTFREQAESDYDIYCDFKQRPDIPLCHKLHYLQMASEKLAKAFLASFSGNRQPPRTHRVLVRFLKISKGRPEIRGELGYENNYHAYCAYIDNLLQVAKQVEILAPTGEPDQLNVEYPWRTSTGETIAPTNYPFTEFHNIVALQDLISRLFRISSIVDR